LVRSPAAQQVDTSLTISKLDRSAASITAVVPCETQTLTCQHRFTQTFVFLYESKWVRVLRVGFIKSNCIQQGSYRPRLSVANNKEAKHKANNHASLLQYLPESRIPANKIETPGKGVCDRGLGSQSSILQSLLLLQFSPSAFAIDVSRFPVKCDRGPWRLIFCSLTRDEQTPGP
jgi:hypothetical protein